MPLLDRAFSNGIVRCVHHRGVCHAKLPPCLSEHHSREGLVPILGLHRALAADTTINNYGGSGHTIFAGRHGQQRIFSERHHCRGHHLRHPCGRGKRSRDLLPPQGYFDFKNFCFFLINALINAKWKMISFFLSLMVLFDFFLFVFINAKWLRLISFFLSFFLSFFFSFFL